MIEEPQDLEQLAEDWLNRIRSARKLEEGWRKEAEAAEAVYAGKKDNPHGKPADFNILYANVETIVPAIYNSTPVPDLRPKYDKDNQDLRHVADVFERVIEAQIDDDALTTEIEAEAQDAYLAGRGVIRLRFDADETEGAVTGERIGFEVVAFRDFVMGHAKRWEEVPWVAFRHLIESEDEFDEELLERQRRNDDEDARKDFEAWEIWDKASRQVLFIRAGDGVVLRQMDDPMGLSGFFPMPPPMQPIKLTGDMTPVCPYQIYRKLAEELDKTTRRINAITDGLKVRGLIAGDATDVTRLSEVDDNELVPVQNLENWAATGGIANAIVWWPVDQAIAVLAQLYQNREVTKQAIYEITGISDIVRGATDAQETYGAQNIKSRWGSLRIKRMQQLVERQVRNIFVMMTEIIASKFSAQTLQEVAGIEITPEMQAIMDGGLKQYRIDVESDSTVRADLSRDKGEMAEFLRSTVEYFQGMAPIAQAQPKALPALVALYSSHARQFNLGKQAEDALQAILDAANDTEQQQATEQAQQEQQQKQDALLAAEERRKDEELEIKRGELKRKIAADESDDENADEDRQFEYDKLRAEQAIESIQKRPVAL